VGWSSGNALKLSGLYIKSGYVGGVQLVEGTGKGNLKSTSFKVSVAKAHTPQEP